MSVAVRGPAIPAYLCFAAFAAGGDEQNRTVDPLLARQVLSQLSYAPISGLYHSGESTLFEFPRRALKIKQCPTY